MLTELRLQSGIKKHHVRRHVSDLTCTIPVAASLFLEQAAREECPLLNQQHRIRWYCTIRGDF